MKKLSAFILVLFFACSLFAGTAEVITEIIKAKNVTMGQVAYLSAMEQQLIDENSSYEEAVDVLKVNGQINKTVQVTDVLDYQQVAHVFSKIWNIHGGLMYTITGGSARYAFIQMKSDGVIASDIDPLQKAFGRDVLNIFTNCQFQYGGMDLSGMPEDDE